MNCLCGIPKAKVEDGEVETATSTEQYVYWIIMANLYPFKETFSDVFLLDNKINKELHEWAPHSLHVLLNAMSCTKTSLAVSRWIGRRSNECQDICRCLENPELVAGGFLQLFHLGWCWPRTRRCKDSDLQSIYIYTYISTICLRNISQVACARWVAATYRSWNYHVAPISHLGGLGKMCFQHFRSHRDTFWQHVISGCASGTWFH